MVFRTVIATDVRMALGPDGTIYSTHSSFDASTIERRKIPGSSVLVVARQANKEQEDVPLFEIPSHLAEFALLPRDSADEFFLSRMWRLLRAVRNVSLSRADLVIVRIPEMVSVSMWFRSLFSKSKRVAFLVAEPEDFANRLPLPSGLGKFLSRSLAKFALRSSHGVIYVTESTQRVKYPPAIGQPYCSISNFSLPLELFAPCPSPRYRSGNWADSRRRLLCVGQQNDLEKGHDIAVRALKVLLEEGFDLTLDLVGDGRCSSSLRELARAEGVADLVNFWGQLSSEGVLSRLREADLFLMPSRTEGLPRSMVEAMSQGVASVGSNVGGIPELVPVSKACFESDSVAALASSVKYFLSNQQACHDLAGRQLAIAQSIALRSSPSAYSQFLSQVVGPGE